MQDFELHANFDAGHLADLVQVFCTLNTVWQTIVVTGLATLGGWLIPRSAWIFGLSVGSDARRFQPLSALTYGLLHANIGHFLGNACGIFLAGSIVLNHGGPSQYFLVYLGGSIGTGLLAPLLDRSGEGRRIVGSSCGVYAVIGGVIALAPPTVLFRVMDFDVTLVGIACAGIISRLIQTHGHRGSVYHFGHALGGLLGIGATKLMQSF